MAIDILTPLNQGLAIRGQLDKQEQMRQQQRMRQEQMNRSRESEYYNLNKQRQEAIFKDAESVLTHLNNNQLDKAIGVTSDRIGFINQFGGSPRDAQEIQDLIISGDIDRVKSTLKSVVDVGRQQGFLIDPRVTEANIAKATGDTAEIRSFENLVKKAGLNEDDSKHAARIFLGLESRAVGSSAQTIAKKGTAQEVAQVKATIKQAEKFAELTGTSRAKAIDAGFEQIGKINTNIGNMDRAIQLLDSGAKTGAIEKFLPSVKAATVELNNLRNRLGLDVIGAVTFGALSKGELDLALDTALPTGLDEPELKDFLTRKKQAQEKLRGYLESQIQFFDGGGTKAGFLRNQKAQSGATGQQPTPQKTTNDFTGFKVIR